MLHQLPIRNACLLACPEDWHQMTLTDHGRHRRSCDQEVVDFTQTSAAALAARAASAAGRVCGRFRLSQRAGGQPVRFGLWARAFALALMFGQGLTAREAWAQTRKVAPARKAPVRRPPARPKPAPAAKPIADEPTEGSVEQEYILEPGPELYVVGPAPFEYERPPEAPGGLETLRRYLSQHIQYPERARRRHVQGLVLVSFVVSPEGQLTNVSVAQGIGYGCDEEAVRVVSGLPRWEPARRNGRAVAVGYTLPVRFELTEAQ